MTENIPIPPEFIKTLTKEDWDEIMETGMLNRRLCRRLWAMQGRTDKPPHKLMIMINREDLMRMFPPKS